MIRKICLLLCAPAFSVSAHASTLGNISGLSGWAKFIAFISVPNFLVLMVALPFFVASRMKGAAVSRIAMHILVYEILVAGAGWLILYLVFSLN